MAKVNGQIITLSDFQSRQIAAAQAARVDPANVGTFLRQNNAKILQDAIDEILILQKAEDAGINAPPQWVDEAIDGIKKENNITTRGADRGGARARGAYAWRAAREHRARDPASARARARHPRPSSR